MTEKELKSLAFQIKFIYAYNRRATFPVNIIMSNYTQIQDYLDKKHKKWDITFLKEQVIQNINNIVYLTPDAPETLQNIEKDKVYVIGGLVDRNQQKNLVYDYCIKNNIECYKLPIKENIKLCASPVLTVNQVFEILSVYTRSGRWDEAIEQCMPKRKLHKYKKD